LSDEDIAQFDDTATQITATERRATLAERDSSDRYLALYLQHRVGELFPARVSGVTKFGLFVTLTQSGASGFISMSSLGDDFWMYDEASQSLSGKRCRQTFHLAQPLDVRLLEARPVTGGLLFSPADANPAPADRKRHNASGRKPGMKTKPKRHR
jgi:ribonuclease R